MSGAVAVLTITALLTLCGLGVLALIGVAPSVRDLRQRAGLAPLAGMASAGIVGATLATLGARLSVGGLIGLTGLACAAGGGRLAVGGQNWAGPSRQRLRSLELVGVIAAVATIAVVSTFAVAAFRVKPLLEYDGWAIWGMKARAIATLGSADADVFASDAYARLHIEYPLLLPSLHALPVQAADGFTSNTVILQSLAVGAAGLLAIWALFRDRVRPVLLLSFLAAIAAMPAFFVQLGTGYADVPLGVFVACGLAAAARWLVDGGLGWLALATLSLASAVLTKNEGLLFAAAAYVPLLIAASGRRRPVAVSALIVALIYLPWRAYITVHHLGAPDYELSSSLNLPWVVGRLDRIPPAASGLLGEAFDPRQFTYLLAIGLAAGVLAFMFGQHPLGLLVTGFAVLSLAGLTWIYVLTPNDVDDYLSSNGHRVVVSLVLGMAAVTPLVIEECARTGVAVAERMRN